MSRVYLVGDEQSLCLRQVAYTNFHGPQSGVFEIRSAIAELVFIGVGQQQMHALAGWQRQVHAVMDHRDRIVAKQSRHSRCHAIGIEYHGGHAVDTDRRVRVLQKVRPTNQVRRQMLQNHNVHETFDGVGAGTQNSNEGCV